MFHVIHQYLILLALQRLYETMSTTEGQTGLGNSCKTFLKSSNSLRKFYALFYILKFQMSIKLWASWLKIVKLNKALNST